MDPETIIAELHSENLCTYFVLPLLKINKSNFASEENFIDSYLTSLHDTIVVKVNDVLFFEHRMVFHPQYVRMWKDKPGKYYVEYSIPEKWKPDVELFVQGQFSRMSVEAKELIMKFSGLPYRVKRQSDQVTITDARLLAVNRSPAVRIMWENHYNVLLSDEDELLSKPGEKSFIDCSSFTLFPI